MIDLIKKLYKKINKPLNIMEVCGTHTVAIRKSGIRGLLPENIKFLSGPGCPVCVTSINDIDKIIALAKKQGVILATYGDMMRVPGGRLSLSEIKAEGADIRIIYSPLECLKIASENQDKKVVFFSAGFETTVPSVSATLSEAERLKIDNFLIYSAHKLVPPALDLLLQSQDVKINGFILPGHVSTIIGSKPYKFISEKYSIPAVITGFKGEDILTSIAMILRQIIEQKAEIEIQYKSFVKEEGNPKAVEFMNKYFEVTDSYWRGIGLLPKSGLKLKNEYKYRDVEFIIPVEVMDYPEPKGCMCGLVLRGIKTPPECPMFGKICTPQKPVGACMVSTEGSCAAYYNYDMQDNLRKL